MSTTQTPLMRQYTQIKSKYPDTVLLFRLGDFYETFGDDAVTTAKACGITLTKRNNGSAGEIPLAGFPHHQLDTYLPKLVRAGHRVAVCEQLEDPKQAKGIVRRDVVEVVTPGVVLYDKLLDNNAHTFVACLCAPQGKRTIPGLAYADVSTGTFSAGDVAEEKIVALLESLQPAELVVNKDDRPWWEAIVAQLTVKPSLTRLESWHFEHDFTQTTILRHFDTVSLKGFGAASLGCGTLAAGALLYYVGETSKSSLDQITGMSVIQSDGYMVLDAATRRNLEIHGNGTEEGRHGALVNIIGATVTAMGGRLLRWRLQAPLTDILQIRARHAVVRALLHDRSRLDALRTDMRRIGDLERIMTKIVTNRATPRDLVGLRSSLEQLPVIKALCAESSSDFVRACGADIDEHTSITELLQRALVDDPSLHVGSGAIFKPGFDADIDAARDALVNGKTWIANYQEAERTATGIGTLKVGSTGVFGYYIEISNTHKSRVPEHYDRRQTLANAERYTTPELRKLEQTLLHAEEHMTTRESALLDAIKRTVSQATRSIQQTAQAIARLDVLATFASVAIENAYCEPVMHEGSELDIVDARHPVIEKLLPTGTTYVANSIHMDTERSQISIITGPNMSGKSSYLRQVGLITYLAHIGSFVPATSARIGLTDRIFTRVGAQDNITAGESTFLVEMQESANILNNATKRSLILLDEVGRGTATFDGISIAWAMAEYIHEVIGAKTLFATHYHELTALADRYERIQQVQVEVREVGDSIVFTHRVVPGHSDHSFGIHVARMAGLPPAVITSAKAILRQLESGDHRPQIDGSAQMSLFELRDDALRERIRSLDIPSMTPLQALQLLADLKGSLDE
jgi:DNA mismatch repair protein MutS